MATQDLESTCKQLLEEGQQERARELLLKRGFTGSLDPDAQALFLELFPRGEAPEKGLDGQFAALGSSDPALRLKAARKINSVARGNWTKSRGEWLTHPRSIGALLDALEGADGKTAIELVRAISAASQRYKFPDLRIRERLLSMFDDAPDALRIGIVAAIPQFGGPDVWRVVAKGLACRPAKAAHFAVGLAATRYGKSAAAAEQALLARGLEAACATQRNLDTLHSIVAGLRAVGDARSVETLHALKGRFDSESFEEGLVLAEAACLSRAAGADAAS